MDKDLVEKVRSVAQKMIYEISRPGPIRSIEMATELNEKEGEELLRNWRRRRGYDVGRDDLGTLFLYGRVVPIKKKWYLPSESYHFPCVRVHVDIEDNDETRRRWTDVGLSFEPMTREHALRKGILYITREGTVLEPSHK